MYTKSNYEKNLDPKIYTQAIETLKELTGLDWIIGETGNLSMIPDNYYSGCGNGQSLNSIKKILKPYGIYPEQILVQYPNSHALELYHLTIDRPLEIKALADKQLAPLNINADRAITVLKKVTGRPEWSQEKNELHLKQLLKLDYTIADPRARLITEMVNCLKIKLDLSAQGENNVYLTNEKPSVYGITVKIYHPWELFQFVNMLDGVCYHISRFELMRRKENSLASQLPKELVIHLYTFILQVYNFTFCQPTDLISMAESIFGKKSIASLPPKEGILHQEKSIFTSKQTMFHNQASSKNETSLQSLEQKKLSNQAQDDSYGIF